MHQESKSGREAAADLLLLRGAGCALQPDCVSQAPRRLAHKAAPRGEREGASRSFEGGMEGRQQQLAAVAARALPAAHAAMAARATVPPKEHTKGEDGTDGCEGRQEETGCAPPRHGTVADSTLAPRRVCVAAAAMAALSEAEAALGEMAQMGRHLAEMEALQQGLAAGGASKGGAAPAELERLAQDGAKKDATIQKVQPLTRRRNGQSPHSFAAV